MDNKDIIRKNNVVVTGNPDAARTLIFSHGFGSDQNVWSRVIPAFLDDYRVITYDLVGAGGSDPAAFVQHRYLRLEAFAQDLADLCAALGLRDAVAVGHSMGGMISLLATLKRPECFSRLIMLGASPRFLDDENYRGGFTKDDLNGVYRAMQTNFSQWADNFAPLMIGEEHPVSLARYLADSLRAIPPQKALTVACAVFQSDHRADLGKVTKPTLIVQTLHDHAVPMEVAHFLHEHIPGSELSVIDTTGHLPHVTAPEAVIAAIRAFL